MKQWKDMGHSLGGYRCITLEGTGELALSSQCGEIWSSGVGTYKAVVFNPTGSEKIISFKSDDLNKWHLKLEIPLSAAEQARYANAFGKNL